MLSAVGGEIALGKPHAENDCHIDEYVAKLYSNIRCELTQGYKRDEDGEYILDEDGNRIRKPVGTIHLGDAHPDPVMMVRVGLRGPLLHHLCGTLCVRVHLECIGTGPEEDFTTREQPIGGPCEEGKPGKKCCDKGDEEWCYYYFEVAIDKDVFEKYEGDCGEFCCFATTATSYDRCGNPGHIGCWCKGPCVMIHQAPES